MLRESSFSLRRLWITVAFVLGLAIVGSVYSENDTRPPAGAAVDIPVVESAHPYDNNSEESWYVDNTSGMNAARLHFTRIELEEEVDKIEILDSNDVLIQEIAESHPNGLWTDVVPGSAIKIVLKSDGSGRFWGFEADQLEPLSYQTVAYTAHPYPRDSKTTLSLANPLPSPDGTRVRFSRLELEENVDYLIVKDVDDTPYQWITGSYPTGLTTKTVPGSVIKIQLISDGSVQEWGYNISAVEEGTPDSPDVEPSFPTLAESEHPYPPVADQTWTIANPDTEAVSSKIRFSRITLETGDQIQVLDENDTVIQTFGQNTHLTDFWSDIVPGRIVKIRLTAGDFISDWGFRVDAIANAGPNPGLVQSDHPYLYNLDRTWTIVNPDPDAVSSKVHFSRIDLEDDDKIQLLDENDTVIQTFGQNTHLTDFWSDYAPGRIVKIRFVTNDSVIVDWGFRLDKIVNAVPNPGLAQSDHPYPRNSDQTWTIINPNLDAVSSRIHFNRIDLNQGDQIQVMDENETVIQTFGQNTHLTDVWSDPVPGRIVRIRLVANDYHDVDWGFRVDEIYPVSDEPIPPAYISGIYITVLEPGTIYLNDVPVAVADEAGEYKILLSGPGKYTARIEYLGYTQEIEISIGVDGQLEILYLPLLQKE